MHKPDRVSLNINHPNAGGAEVVLNSWPGSFVLETAANDQYTFRSAHADIQVQLLFFDTQQEAIGYGRRNFDPVSPLHTWGINGGLLYCITGPDKKSVSSLASDFAGKE